jgi:flavin-dependent dehydrogenase
MALGIEQGSLYDVAVVGAGPAGSSMAAALAERGWHVLLVERDEFPRHKVCGEFISPEAQGTLHRLGLYEEIAARKPIPLNAVKISSCRSRTLQRDLPGEAWGLSRYEFDAELAKAAVARGVELRTATTATRHEIGDGQVELQLRDPQRSTRVYARSVIMAYGRSPLPGLTPGDGTQALSSRGRCVGAKCHYTGVHMEQQVELYFFPGGYAGLNPVEGGHVNLCLLVTYAAFARAGRSIEGIMQAAINGNPLLAQRMAGARAVPDTQCAVAPVDTYRAAQPWRTVAQLGDSAVMLPPLCGDGMAMALRSTELCTPLAVAYLRGQLSLAAWQKNYHQRWSQEFGQRVRLGRWLQQLLLIPLLADGMLLTGSLVPALADYFITSTRGAVAADSMSLARTSG